MRVHNSLSLLSFCSFSLFAVAISVALNWFVRYLEYICIYIWYIIVVDGLLAETLYLIIQQERFKTQYE